MYQRGEGTRYRGQVEADNRRLGNCKSSIRQFQAERRAAAERSRNGRNNSATRGQLDDYKLSPGKSVCDGGMRKSERKRYTVSKYAIYSFKIAQLQCTVQERDSAVAGQAQQYVRDIGEMVNCTKSMGLSGGGVHWRRHIEATAHRGEAF